MAHGLRNLRFACTRCGNCCRRFRVPLTHEDVVRLSELAPPDDFIEWLSADEIDMSGEPETFVVLPAGKRLMVLGWRDFGCRFLEGDLCGAHPQRPLSCRLYPFAPVLGRKGGISRLRLLDLTNCEHTVAASQPPWPIARLAQQHRAELAAYAGKVGKFNRRQAHRSRLGKRLLDADAFLRYLGIPRPQDLPQKGSSDEQPLDPRRI